MTDLAADTGFNSRFIRARDGLKLHMQDYGPLASPALPVVCLPGFARTAADRVRSVDGRDDTRAEREPGQGACRPQVGDRHEDASSGREPLPDDARRALPRHSLRSRPALHVEQRRGDEEREVARAVEDETLAHAETARAATRRRPACPS